MINQNNLPSALGTTGQGKQIFPVGSVQISALDLFAPREMLFYVLPLSLKLCVTPLIEPISQQLGHNSKQEHIKTL